ncbi:aminopeptidase N [Thalassorhabdomicrobium marinisediminis]|uniref:Aminopeptidase N n=1 Tax=Thalassorhabdomicrobium marinisediminis TaxID=2170577 RepID=A0A2T7FY02_9RHOB|nr:aminopeptidase N [Thalassorhabdomicrobium marinisediminis]PVA07039.1 aminopeptidase N [Thalassorhabdomicrobium marinisediminis]
MKDASPQTIYLSDYRPFGYHVDTVHLTFRLHPTQTRVISRIAFRPNTEAPGPFFLHGEDMQLISAKIDGVAVSPEVTDKGLTCTVPDAPFVWEAEVEISPQTNTALEGLYMSNGMYCTQCEAEGFRKITFYPDRPDVMSVFTTRIESDLPVMLSNGNPVDQGDGWAEWHDPWRKPAYLFALVAGDLAAHSGQFTTMSGKDVTLNLYVRPGPDEGKCAFGMEALKRAMRWDEEVYGREYDLDIFNIVAVDDFNAGAMENKGLNIFNSSCVLASPDTSTDANYERIDAIIAHEYFHNWTGNRITCRDWFQLCLKEGLTVFRDQQYTGDQGSHAVKRIEDAIVLRSRQFREDNGPLAHPVRPESFIEINNFYTITVYEKGAELIGMLKRLVGDEAYYKAVDLYFDRHDGEAATIEDWLKVFEDATGRDLTQFKRWYSQAGTPRVTVTDDFKDGTYTLHFKQETPPTPGQEQKEPQVIPIAVGLLSPNGDEVMPTTMLEMTETEQSFSFDGLGAKPVPSILRDFSAPVILERAESNADRAFLMAHDTDPFNKWDAADKLAKSVLRAMIISEASPDQAYLDGVAAILRDDTLDPAFRALCLTLPSEDDLAQALHDAGTTPDPMAIHTAREALKLALAQHLQDTLPRIRAAMTVEGPYSPDAKSAGKRSLGTAALALLSRLDGGAAAQAQFAGADNMTLQLAALSVLLQIGKGDAESAAFRDQWRNDRLVTDKWFGLKVATAAPEDAAAVAEALTREPDFDMKNPNRFRAVFGALAGHSAGFHHPSGAAYDLLGDWISKLDGMNPQTAARMTTAFETWRRYDADRQAKMRAVLHRIAATDGLSPDTAEMVSRILGDAE